LIDEEYTDMMLLGTLKIMRMMLSRRQPEPSCRAAHQSNNLKANAGRRGPGTSNARRLGPRIDLRFVFFFISFSVCSNPWKTIT